MYFRTLFIILEIISINVIKLLYYIFMFLLKLCDFKIFANKDYRLCT